MYKRIYAMTLVFALSAGSLSISSYASPIFARSQEEWDKLRDNKLEYSEIEALIEEYNPKVIENSIKLNDFKREYGSTNSTLRERYTQMADEILSNIVEPEAGSPMYLGALVANMQARNSADNLLDIANKSVDDVSTMRLGFDNAKLGLIKSAKNNMVNYHSMLLDVDKLELLYEMAVAEENIKNIKRANGLASELELINAKSAALDALNNLNQAKAKKDNIEQKLIVMCGWKYSSKAEIDSLPTVDMEAIGNIKLEEDIRKALENNFTLRINEEKLKNSSSSSEIEALDKTISLNRANIENDIRALYQNILAAKKDYENSSKLFSANSNTLLAIEKKRQLGMISDIEAKRQIYNFKELEAVLKKSEFNLLNSMENYDIAVKGLAVAIQ